LPLLAWWLSLLQVRFYRLRSAGRKPLHQGFPAFGFLKNFKRNLKRLAVSGVVLFLALMRARETL
jgi:hypothetical protein